MGAVGRFGKSQAQSCVDCAVDGDFDQVLPPCDQDLRNPGIHTYLAGIYRLFIKIKKSHAYSNFTGTHHLVK